jgi:hypothetical protein
VDHEERFPPDKPYKQQSDGHGTQIGVVYTGSFLLPRSRHTPRETLQDDKVKQGGEDEQDQRIAVQTIAEPLCPSGLLVFTDRHDLDFPAASSPVEIAGSGMVGGVLLSPAVVGRQSQHTQQESENIVGPLGFEEGSVATVVLDNEKPDQEAGRWQRQQ